MSKSKSTGKKYPKAKTPMDTVSLWRFALKGSFKFTNTLIIDPQYININMPF